MAKLLDCGHKPSPCSDMTTGYGETDGKHYCYDCCAERDKDHMRKHGKITLYLSTGDEGRHYVTNWPNSLRIQCSTPKVGYHNMARKRYDVWFKFDGSMWRGVQYGDNTQLCHCRKTKGA